MPQEDYKTCKDYCASQGRITWVDTFILWPRRQWISIDDSARWAFPLISGLWGNHWLHLKLTWGEKAYHWPGFRQLAVRFIVLGFHFQLRSVRHRGMDAEGMTLRWADLEAPQLDPAMRRWLYHWLHWFTLSFSWPVNSSRGHHGSVTPSFDRKEKKSCDYAFQAVEMEMAQMAIEWRFCFDTFLSMGWLKGKSPGSHWTFHWNRGPSCNFSLKPIHWL